MSELPFELSIPMPEEGITFCGVKIPKYGSLTPNEAIALSSISLDSGMPVIRYYAEIGNIILRSRTKLRPYTVDELMDLPIQIAQLKELFDFVISENRQWKEEEETKTDEGESPTGQISTGDSEQATPAKKSSAQKTLVTAPL